MTATIELTDSVTPAMQALLSGGLKVWNDAQAGYADRRDLAVMAHDAATGEMLGGAVGRTSLGLMFLDLFHLPESSRGAGLGSAILSAFEAEGRARGCLSGVLYTISFQAPGFYERHGWRRFGEIPCQPPGTSRIFMTKLL